MHHAVDVADPDILALRAHRDQEIETGDRRGAGTRGDDLDVFKLLAVQEQRIGDRGADDNGGAMLIVVEYPDLHPRPELPFDLRTLPTLAILKTDSAQPRVH